MEHDIRPWGEYWVLEDANTHKVKRIQVVEVVKGEDMPNYKLEIEPPTELGADRMDLLGDLGKAGNLDNPRFRDYLNKSMAKMGIKYMIG